jgi:hypothetical protein
MINNVTHNDKEINMPVILGKSKPLVPRGVRVIKYVGHPEANAIKLTTQIAKAFGQQSKKIKPKKIIIR